MFTGIIEDIGTLTALHKKGQGLTLTVQLSTLYPDDKIGDSISVDGVCLTVESFHDSSFTATASEETLSLTNFKNFKQGTKVNIERAARLGDRLGGHLVTGHVETTAIIKKILPQEVACFYTFQLEQDLSRYLIHKGSIAISGISLTVNHVDDMNHLVSVAIIPHTLVKTTLSSAKVGDVVNIEADMIAKYIEKLLVREDNVNRTNLGLTEDFLRTHGFV